LQNGFIAPEEAEFMGLSGSALFNNIALDLKAPSAINASFAFIS